MRLFRTLLRLFPADFRRKNGAAMEALFADMYVERREEGRGPGAGFWFLLTWDMGREAAAEWFGVAHDVIRSGTAMTRGEPMFALWGDVRFALRQLRRQPTYAVTVIVLMAVGVAGNAAVFRVVNGLFIRPLPFQESERLVDLDETAPTWDLEFLSIAYRDFDRWRAENQTFESMAAFDLGGGGNTLIDGTPVRVTYLRATHDIDDVLGIEPLLGRFFGPEEDRPDGPRAAVLSRAFWTQRFAGDPGVLGTTLSLDGHPVEVVGVLPPEAEFVAETDLWLPLRGDPADFDGWGLSGIGRLRDGVTVEQAREDLTAVHKAMIPEFEVNEISSPVVHSLRDRYLGDYRLGSSFLLGSVAIVLLIACANIAALVFARSLARGSELSLRMALGAPRSRIARQLLTESVVLAGVGGVVGVVLGIWGSSALVRPLAEQFPRWVRFDLDGRFLAFTLGVTVAAAVLFGLAPALRASSPRAPLASNRATGSRHRRRAMGALVAGEVAMAMTLLVVGALTLLDVQRLGHVDPGFRSENLVSYSLALPDHRYEDEDARLAFVEEYLGRLEAAPGIQSATITSGLPLSGHWGWFFQVDGAPPRGEGESDPVVLNRVVGPDYFETVGIELVAGRALNDFDGRERGSGAVVVNETFVRTHLAHLENPVGARITPGTDIGHNPWWFTVVGVARDVKHYGVDEEMRPGVYQPLRQLPLAGFEVALRVMGDPGPSLAAARAITAELDPELPLFGVATMTETLDEALWTRRAISWLIAAFSGVALLLAVAGIYGVVSYSVSQRTHEIGIRMAMGAHTQDVTTQVVRQGMVLVMVGAGVGLLVSMAGADLVSGILVGVDALEPAVYGVVTVLLLAVATLANYLPARRAARLSPMAVLRDE